MTSPLSLLHFLNGLGGEAVERHGPWPRLVVDEAAWKALIGQLAVSRWSLLGLWAEQGVVHMALRDAEGDEFAVASLPCPDGRFPSVSGVRPSAQRLERAIQDLYGMTAVGLADGRPWLDHGRWPLRHPLAASPGEPGQMPPYEFLPVLGEGLHQIPVGPVHAGIIEPGHFRFHANGEAVARLEERLGYVHKGVEKLMEGRSVAEAGRIIARLSGDSTVAYGFAFALAVEAALRHDPPPRAIWLRGLMAELERIANHLGDIGAICNDASFAVMLALCGALRERVLRAADQCFGHRLMMDRVVPGGVTHDLNPEGAALLRSLVSELRPALADVVHLYDEENSLLDRTMGTGIVSGTLVHRFGAGGIVGRASNRDIDARRTPCYAPYGFFDFDVPTSFAGDVNARVWMRMREVASSLDLIEAMVRDMPSGDLMSDLPAAVGEGMPAAAGEGMALVEGFRGEILVWVRLDADGRIARCHPRDPSWFQWPLLEAAIKDNIVADFPLCNKSFNCSYSGHDL
ncbi:MAG: NADH-quinone oxidoreductase subunit C [Alphaproteobacteria bacterium]|nr:NADH-quinone oxidoreductase subunit C [Alphaproteobacteria bacterium]